MARLSAEQRFWRRIEKDPATGCWVWTGSLRGGYGRFNDGTRLRTAHRWAYEHFVGPIPEGLDLDHLCRNRACSNPSHLEPVTRLENLIRAPRWDPTRTHCTHGHELTAENTYMNRRGGPECKICRRAADIRRYRARGHQPRGLRKSVCRNGHEMTVENTYIYGNRHICRSCLKANRERHLARRGLPKQP